MEGMIAVRFIGTQKGVPEWGIPTLELFNITEPGFASHGTTFAMPPGSSDLELQVKAYEVENRWLSVRAEQVS